MKEVREPNKELRETVYLLEFQKAQLSALERQLELLEISTSDNLRAKQTLTNYKSLAPEAQILIPIGGESFVFARVDKGKRAITNIGGGVVIETSIHDSIDKIDSRLKELEAAKKKILANAQSVQNELDRLTQKARSLTEEKNV